MNHRLWKWIKLLARTDDTFSAPFRPECHKIHTEAVLKVPQMELYLAVFSGGCGFHSQWVMSRCKCPITSLLPGHTWTCRCHGRWDRTQQKDLFPRYFRMFLDCGAYASSTEVNDSVRKSVLNILTILFVSSPLHSSLSSPDGAVCQCALAPPTRRWFYAQWRVFNLCYFVY